MISCQGEVEKKNTTYFGYQIKIMTLTNHKNTWLKWQVTNPVAGCTKSNIYYGIYSLPTLDLFDYHFHPS